MQILRLQCLARPCGQSRLQLRGASVISQEMAQTCMVGGCRCAEIRMQKVEKGLGAPLSLSLSLSLWSYIYLVATLGSTRRETGALFNSGASLSPRHSIHSFNSRERRQLHVQDVFTKVYAATRSILAARLCGRRRAAAMHSCPSSLAYP
jgi:hypothetical protein